MDRRLMVHWFWIIALKYGFPLRVFLLVKNLYCNEPASDFPNNIYQTNSWIYICTRNNGICRLWFLNPHPWINLNNYQISSHSISDVNRLTLFRQLNWFSFFWWYLTQEFVQWLQTSDFSVTCIGVHVAFLTLHLCELEHMCILALRKIQ